MKTSVKFMAVATVAALAAVLVWSVAYAAAGDGYDDLPFKNNIDKNLKYAQNLYEFGNRDQSLQLYRLVIDTFGRANALEEKAKAHYALGTLYFRQEKRWKLSERSANEQAAWERECNEKAISELTEYLRCFSDNRSSQRGNVQYDTVFKMIIAIYDENGEYDKAIDWLSQYEDFRNPGYYEDSVDFIKFMQAEMLRKAGRYAEAYDLYRQVFLGYAESAFSRLAQERYDTISSEARKALREYAERLMAQAKYVDALAKLEAYCEEFPADAEALELLDTMSDEVSRILSDPRHFRLVNTITGCWPYGLTFTTDGKHLVTGSSEGQVRMWDTATLGEETALTGHTAHVTNILSPGSDELITSSSDRTIRVWTLSTRREKLPPIGSDSYVRRNCLAYAPKGDLLVAGLDDGRIKTWIKSDGSPKKELLPAEDSGGIQVLTATLDGDLAYVGFGNKKLVALSLPSLSEARTVELEFVPLHLAISPDGSLLAVVGDDQKVRVYSRQDLELMWESTEQGSGLRVVHITPTSGLVVTGADSGTVTLWDAESGQEIRSLVGGADGIRAIALSPDQTVLVTGDNQERMLVYAVPR